MCAILNFLHSKIEFQNAKTKLHSLYKLALIEEIIGLNEYVSSKTKRNQENIFGKSIYVTKLCGIVLNAAESTV